MVNCFYGSKPSQEKEHNHNVLVCIAYYCIMANDPIYFWCFLLFLVFLRIKSTVQCNMLFQQCDAIGPPPPYHVLAWIKSNVNPNTITSHSAGIGS